MVKSEIERFASRLHAQVNDLKRTPDKLAQELEVPLEEVQKVLAGVQAACGKRPIPEQFKVRLAQQVEEEIHREYEREVPSTALGELVADKLRELDQIAYIRFASEYHDFRTLEEFARELNQLRERTKNLPNQHNLFPNK